jgi:amino acid transporter
LLLLSAASSSFQAGPGLLKALARQCSTSQRRARADGERAGAERVGAEQIDEADTGILPRVWGATNRHHTPYWGVVLFFIISAVVIMAAGGQDQRLVLFYAVSVFLSFLAGLVAMARFSARQRHIGQLVVNVVGAVAVAFTLVVNLARVEPIASLAAALIIAALLYGLWVRAGRPRGIRNVAAEAEQTT